MFHKLEERTALADRSGQPGTKWFGKTVMRFAAKTINALDGWRVWNLEMTDSYMYAALVLHKAGKKVDEQGLTSVVKAAGVEVDTVKVKALASALSEINIDEALKNAATMAVAAAPAAAAPAAAKAEEKPKEEEKKEEEALAGLASLFG
jgi:large subunit ribosomal protein L12